MGALTLRTQVVVFVAMLITDIIRCLGPAAWPARDRNGMLDDDLLLDDQYLLEQQPDDALLVGDIHGVSR